MERVLDRCAGLDVHKKTVTACGRVPDTSRGRTQHVRTFATTAAELLMLRDWLEAHGVTWPWRAPGSTGDRCSTSWRRRAPVS
jgi:transposase